MTQKVVVDIKRTMFPTKEVKNFRLKFYFWMTLATFFGITIIGLPVAFIIFVFVNHMYNKHHNWLEDQGLTLDKFNRVIKKEENA